MFTGIVQDIGRVSSVEARGGDLRLTIEVSQLPLARERIGASIAVNGVCLTAVELRERHFSADVSRATLAATTLGAWQVDRRVNLEAALRAGEPLGGHMVSGHVDGVGHLLERSGDARSVRMVFALPAALAHLVASKGSIAIDGVSLTVTEVGTDRCTVNLVPHTLAATTLGVLNAGVAVNLEVDSLARYAARLYEMMRA